MKRPERKSPANTSKESKRLLDLAEEASGATSRIERDFWIAQIETVATDLLDAGKDSAIESALEKSFNSSPDAHDLLSEAAEAAGETCFFHLNGIHYTALLISVPMVAWSKYPIASGSLKASEIAPIAKHLQDIILAEGSQFIMLPFLYSMDHLPQSFSETRELLKFLADAVMNDDKLPSLPKEDETIDMPADIRMLVGAVIAPYGKPMFRWQTSFATLAAPTTKAATKPATKVSTKTSPTKAKSETASSRATCLVSWADVATAKLAKLIPGAEFELGLPDAYFSNLRQSDIRVRPRMITGAVEHLELALKRDASEMHAIIASVGEMEIDEYRIGFALKNSATIVNGTIWPLIAAEDDEQSPSPREQIEALLKAANIGKITKLPGVLPPEYCEDCGAPLFYDAEGEAVHPHMPDDSNFSPAHYH